MCSGRDEIQLDLPFINSETLEWKMNTKSRFIVCLAGNFFKESVMLRTVAVTAALLLVASVSFAAEGENPFKNAKVGDWVSYTTTSKMAGMEMQMEMKQTVSKKTDEEATIDVSTKVHGQDIKSSFTVKLNEKYDPRKMQMAGAEVEVKELGTGEEELDINGKKIKTKWAQYETTGKANGQPFNSKGKSWVSTEVPLGGMVKSETELKGMGLTTMVLKDFGRGQ